MGRGFTDEDVGSFDPCHQIIANLKTRQEKDFAGQIWLESQVFFETCRKRSAK